METSIGCALVQSTSGRGFSPEELSERAVNKIVSISEMADPMVQAQARAFKDRVQQVILHALRQAVLSEQTTMFNKLVQAGHPELVALFND